MNHRAVFHFVEFRMYHTSILIRLANGTDVYLAGKKKHATIGSIVSCWKNSMFVRLPTTTVPHLPGLVSHGLIRTNLFVEIEGLVRGTKTALRRSNVLHFGKSNAGTC